MAAVGIPNPPPAATPCLAQIKIRIKKERNKKKAGGSLKSQTRDAAWGQIVSGQRQKSNMSSSSCTEEKVEEQQQREPEQTMRKQPCGMWNVWDSVVNNAASLLPHSLGYFAVATVSDRLWPCGQGNGLAGVGQGSHNGLVRRPQGINSIYYCRPKQKLAF